MSSSARQKEQLSPDELSSTGISPISLANGDVYEGEFLDGKKSGKEQLASQIGAEDSFNEILLEAKEMTLVL